MKTYIVYVDGHEVEMLSAGSHNAAEKKAQKKYITTSKVNNYLRANSWLNREQVIARLNTTVTVAYTEI